MERRMLFALGSIHIDASTVFNNYQNLPASLSVFTHGKIDLHGRMRAESAL